MYINMANIKSLTKMEYPTEEKIGHFEKEQKYI